MQAQVRNRDWVGLSFVMDYTKLWQLWFPANARPMAQNIWTLALLGWWRQGWTLPTVGRSWATWEWMRHWTPGTVLYVCHSFNKSYHYTSPSQAWIPKMLFSWFHGRTLFPPATPTYLPSQISSTCAPLKSQRCLLSLCTLFTFLPDQFYLSGSFYSLHQDQSHLWRNANIKSHISQKSSHSTMW